MMTAMVAAALLFDVAVVAHQEPAEVRVVREFSRRMGIALTGKYQLSHLAYSSASGSSGAIMLVDFGPHGFEVHSKRRVVVGYRQGERLRRASNASLQAEPRFATKEAWWTHAFSFLARAKLDDPMSAARIEGLSSSPNGRAGIVSLAFEHRPYTIPTDGAGNTATFDFDRTTGELLSCRFSIGFTVMPPHVSITETRAVEIATEQMRKAAAAEATSVVAVRKRYRRANAFFYTGAGVDFMLAGKVPYCFVVEFPGVHVFVHAETGEIMGGERLGRR